MPPADPHPNQTVYHLFPVCLPMASAAASRVLPSLYLGNAGFTVPQDACDNGAGALRSNLLPVYLGPMTYLTLTLTGVSHRVESYHGYHCYHGFMPLRRDIKQGLRYSLFLLAPRCNNPSASPEADFWGKTSIRIKGMGRWFVTMRPIWL